MFGRRRERDSLFERSFRACSGCGEDVYVLAEDCRECGRAVELVAV
jgi:rRNA maturation protein Nop10